ncbi:hypothetical protein SISNIDRAFT_488114 [Sistotremastrum niveocremeum HHB9708]|uniref:Uncharacterized protein n=1 Tax=Sistotremastrum niveocremeum HHB9708 TaxID=1314777 RepID=A0A164RRV0_9AGAM|nr:hypothetical protein SISNIDRAFT_488114 [Sistotremastrum niveocremeum HHB9708]
MTTVTSLYCTTCSQIHSTVPAEQELNFVTQVLRHEQQRRGVLKIEHSVTSESEAPVEGLEAVPNSAGESDETSDEAIPTLQQIRFQLDELSDLLELPSDYRQTRPLAEEEAPTSPSAAMRFDLEIWRQIFDYVTEDMTLQESHEYWQGLITIGPPFLRIACSSGNFWPVDMNWSPSRICAHESLLPTDQKLRRITISPFSTSQTTFANLTRYSHTAFILSLHLRLSEIMNCKEAMPKLPEIRATELRLVDDTPEELKTLCLPDLSFLLMLTILKLDDFVFSQTPVEDFESFAPCFRVTLEKIHIRPHKNRPLSLFFIVQILQQCEGLISFHCIFSQKPAFRKSSSIRNNTLASPESPTLQGLFNFHEIHDRPLLQELSTGPMERIAMNFIFEHFTFDDTLTFKGILYEPEYLHLAVGRPFRDPLTLPNALLRWTERAKNLEYVVDPSSDTLTLLYSGDGFAHEIYGLHLRGTAPIPLSLESCRFLCDESVKDLKAFFKNVSNARFQGVLPSDKQWPSILTKLAVVDLNVVGPDAGELARCLIQKPNKGNSILQLKLWYNGIQQHLARLKPKILESRQKSDGRVLREDMCKLYERRLKSESPLLLCAARSQMEKEAVVKSSTTSLSPAALRTEVLFASHNGTPKTPENAWLRICRGHESQSFLDGDLLQLS